MVSLLVLTLLCGYVYVLALSVFSSSDRNSLFFTTGISELSDYLSGRDNIFFSSGRDTSLLQMLPCWFPKAVRRLVQLYVQVFSHSLSVSLVHIYDTHLFIYRRFFFSIMFYRL